MDRLLLLFLTIVVVAIAFAAVSAARRDLRAVDRRCSGHSPCCHCCGNDRPAP